MQILRLQIERQDPWPPGDLFGPRVRGMLHVHVTIEDRADHRGPEAIAYIFQFGEYFLYGIVPDVAPMVVDRFYGGVGEVQGEEDVEGGFEVGL